MASSKGRVTLRGRFKPGARVRLVKVKDESVLRAEGGELIEERSVDDDGSVQFTKGVDVGGRYFLVGQIDGHPIEVRARGNTADDEASHVLQTPVQPDRVRLSDGSWADEAPVREDAPFGGVAPGPGQHQVPEGTVQRSDTTRGSAHPVDVSEQEPLPRQEDTDGELQMSDTETGAAAPVVDAPASQGDVPEGVLQRSSTPLGVATVIPSGDAMQAQLVRDSAHARASRGEPVKVAAAPLEQPKGKKTTPRKRPSRSTTAKTAARKPAGKGK